MRQSNDIEDIYGALRMMVARSRKTQVQLAAFLFPNLKYDSANARLSECFSRDEGKRAELTISQLLAAMQFCECYLPFHWLADETGHHRPERKAPDDVEFRLAKAIADAAETLKAAMDQLEKHKSR